MSDSKTTIRQKAEELARLKKLVEDVQHNLPVVKLDDLRAANHLLSTYSREMFTVVASGVVKLGGNVCQREGCGHLYSMHKQGAAVVVCWEPDCACRNFLA